MGRVDGAAELLPLPAGGIETDVVVLGAGIAGLTTAYALAREGQAVVYADLAHRLGAETAVG